METSRNTTETQQNWHNTMETSRNNEIGTTQWKQVATMKLAQHNGNMSQQWNWHNTMETSRNTVETSHNNEIGTTQWKQVATQWKQATA